MNVMLETEGKETSATHSAYVKLCDMILTGELPAGEKLKIEQLRGLLIMRASPVREALSLLTSDILVERIDQRGLRHHHMKKASRTVSHDFEVVHKAFHMALLDNVRQPMLQRYCSPLYDLDIRYRYLAESGASYKKRCISEEHQEILDTHLITMQTPRQHF